MGISTLIAEQLSYKQDWVRRKIPTTERAWLRRGIGYTGDLSHCGYIEVHRCFLSPITPLENRRSSRRMQEIKDVE